MEKIFKSFNSFHYLNELNEWNGKRKVFLRSFNAFNLACSGWLLLTGFPLSGCRYLNAKRCKSVSLQPTSIHLPFPTICMSRGIIDNKQIKCCNLNYIILRFYQNHLNLHWSNHLIPSDSKSIVNVCEVFYCMSWPVAFS